MNFSFTNTILKSVSRSLYTSFRILPPPLRPAMSLGYLFCRMADTIADADTVPQENRLNLLKDMKSLFENFPIKKKSFDSLCEKTRNMGGANFSTEGKLLTQLGPCIDAFQRLTRTDQALTQEVVMGVITGMEMDLKIFGNSLESVKPLPTKGDLENYLRFIGGEPGRFWARLTLVYYPRLIKRNRDRWLEDAVRFGTGLQMINILRDVAEDLHRGRCYIPLAYLKDHHLSVEDLAQNKNNESFLTLYHLLINDALERLEHGLEYILQIPRLSIRLRAAAWWPLAIGLKTLARLRQIRNVFEQNPKVKIGRKEIYKTMAGSSMTLISNSLLKRDFKFLYDKASSSAGFQPG